MALGVPYNVGSTAQAAGVTTTVVTAGTDANSDATSMPASGDAVFVLIGISSTASTVTGVTDSLGNTYTLSGKTPAPGSQYAVIYECLNPSTKPVSGTTFTVTWSGTTAATSSVRVIGCAGVASSAADDQSGTGAGSGTSPAATAGGALAQASELVIAVCQSGSATAGVSSWGTFTQVGHNLRSGSGSYFGAAVLAVSSTSPPSASAVLGASGGWGMLLLTFRASTAGAGGLAVSTTSPLPDAQAGVAYSDQLAATGGVPPYSWSVSSGTPPAGITLQPGGGGGGGSGGGDVTYVGANTGPQGAPDLASFTSAYPVIGPIGCYKFFFTALPSAWSGSLMDQITQAEPGTFCYIAWNTQMSAASIAAFIATIPHTIAEVGFSWQSEPENGAFSSGAAFVAGWNNQAQAVQSAQATTPVKLTLITSHFTNWYQTGGDNSYIPPAQYVDVYGLDFYDRKTYWAGADMSTTVAWKTWTGYVKGLGKPLAMTEFGISGAGTDAAQNTRLQADWAYIQAAFGSGGTLSAYPLYTWLWWDTSYPGTTASPNINEMLGAQTEATWAGIAATQGGTAGSGSGGGGGGGGLLSGTATAAGTSVFTAKVTDSAGTTATKSLSLTVTSAGALAITVTSPLPGATASVPYSTILTASGGTAPYAWSLQSGTLPAGLGITGQLITGTPSGAAGTASFTLLCTDSASATATLAVTLTVSTTLVITTASLPGGTAGVAYSQTLAAAAGTAPYAWSLFSGTIPPGLTLDPVAGTLSGTPATTGAYQLTIAVTDAAGATATQAFSIAISSSAPAAGIGPRLFGGGVADWGFTTSGGTIKAASGITWTFYSAITGGTQYALTDQAGNPITSITTDGYGFAPVFYGPAGVFSMWADGSGGAGPRRQVQATDMGDMLTTLFATLLQ